MRTVFALTLLALAPFSAAAADDLSRRIGSDDGWVSWQVPRVPDAGDACCHHIRGSVVEQRGCDLDGRQWNVSRPGDATGDAGGLIVYAHVSHGTVDKVRAFSATCPVRSAEPLRRIDGHVRARRLLCGRGGGHGERQDDRREKDETDHGTGSGMGWTTRGWIPSP